MSAQNQTNSTFVQYQPGDWFFLPKGSVKPGNAWPWTGLTLDQYAHETARVAAVSYSYEHLVVDMSLDAFGFLGNLLTILTVCTVQKKNMTSFHKIMLSVSILDILFLTVKIARWQTVMQEATGPLATYFYILTSGTVFCFSLMSDMLTVCLTLERFAALAAPLYHRSLSKERKRRDWYCAIIASSCVAATRAHYAFVNYYYTNDYIAQQAWFVALTYFSDTIVPFASTAFMLLLVAGIAKALCERAMFEKVRVGQQGNAQKQNEAKEKFKKDAKTVSLLAALLVTFFVNQVGYMLYDISLKKVQNFTVSYDSTYSEIVAYVDRLVLYVVASNISNTFESGSRSLIFYCYVAMSKSFRKDLYQCVRKMMPCKVGQQNQGVHIGGAGAAGDNRQLNEAHVNAISVAVVPSAEQLATVD